MDATRQLRHTTFGIACLAGPGYLLMLLSLGTVSLFRTDGYGAASAGWTGTCFLAATGFAISAALTVSGKNRAPVGWLALSGFAMSFLAATYVFFYEARSLPDLSIQIMLPSVVAVLAWIAHARWQDGPVAAAVPEPSAACPVAPTEEAALLFSMHPPGPPRLPSREDHGSTPLFPSRANRSTYLRGGALALASVAYPLGALALQLANSLIDWGHARSGGDEGLRSAAFIAALAGYGLAWLSAFAAAVVGRWAKPAATVATASSLLLLGALVGYAVSVPEIGFFFVVLPALAAVGVAGMSWASRRA